MATPPDPPTVPKRRNPISSDTVVPAHPTPEEFRKKCLDVYGVRPCLFQVEFAIALLARKNDVILEVATGMGKTLAFWLPLLYRPRGIQIVVTALNALGQQNVASLAKIGISAVSIDGTLGPARMRQASLRY